ncbi:MAG: HAMP domain-containing histidine kinase [Oscillospiraceae bacterium]|nr:HAMP domain-containing histidine kinase [Oscillospiraceae bacterium]
MRSIRFKLIAFMTALLLLLLLILNTYPISTSRDRVFEEKKNALTSQTVVVASSLSSLETPTADSIHDVLLLLDISGYMRTVVVNSDAVVLYDDKGSPGSLTDIDSLHTALNGNTVFRSSFEGGAFTSSCAVPMYSQGKTVGAVYLSEYDSKQAEMILNIQSRIRALSLIISIAAVLSTAIFSDVLLRRIEELVQSMRIVASGNYGHRLSIRGQDEISELGHEFNILTERLEDTEKQRRRFVSDASHELKTPLASIRLLSDSIVQSENMDSDTIREFVTDIGQEAERLQRTTEKLLTLARFDDDVQVVPVPVDVKQVALDALVFLRPLASERQVRMKTELPDGCVVMATVDDMFQIIFNLMENAIKYNVEGGSVLFRMEADESHIRFRVEDTGIGIPEEDRLNIFARFYRVDKARSREAGGSGLGLSIVHDAVQKHGGSIAVGENKPQGSVFIVSFPRPTPEETGI